MRRMGSGNIVTSVVLMSVDDLLWDLLFCACPHLPRDHVVTCLYHTRLPAGGKFAYWKFPYLPVTCSDTPDASPFTLPYLPTTHLPCPSLLGRCVDHAYSPFSPPPMEVICLFTHLFHLHSCRDAVTVCLLYGGKWGKEGR